MVPLAHVLDQQDKKIAPVTGVEKDSVLCDSPALLSHLRNGELASTPPTLEDEGKNKRKQAHNLIERRSREIINQRFELLDNILRIQHHSEMEKDMKTKRPKHSKRSKRAVILEYAYHDIVNLQAEVDRLEEKLETLRQTAFPDTCKYTMHHSRALCGKWLLRSQVAMQSHSTKLGESWFRV